ncbi:MAG: hypothetical protein J1E61_10340 [Lachnospiraceae bacterium]|nr:hypothetical protein [Lachnospiraceae bacterium]
MKHIFILNPYAGKTMFAENLREKLAQIKGLDYFVFITRYAGYETELVKKICHYFSNEKLRFYCCGGSGTMRNMLNGFKDLSEVEVAFYPCGLTNDFIKCFGEQEKRFYQIEELIDGDVISLDYIRTKEGVAVNTLSLGMDSDYAMMMERYRMSSIFGKQVPYVLALLYVLLVSKPQPYEIYVDDKKLEGQFTELVIGNGCVLGGTMQFAPQSDLTDGKADYVFVHKNGLLPVLMRLAKKDFEGIRKYAECGVCETIRIRRKDGSPIAMNFDGELVQNVRVWEAELVRKGLNLVVPKGVSADAE